MATDATQLAQTLIYVGVLVAAVFSLVVSHGQEILSSPGNWTANTIFGVLTSLIVITLVGALLIGHEELPSEGISLPELTFIGIWIVYFIVGVFVLLSGDTSLVVLANLALAVAGLLVIGVAYFR